MSEPLRLAELVATRVFHDLSGLAGTLAATIELALDEAGQQGKASLPRPTSSPILTAACVSCAPPGDQPGRSWTSRA